MYINQSERAFLGYPSWQYRLVNICVQFFFINTGGFYMPVVRVNKTKDYTVMSNYHLRETNMSLKAKGLLSLMLSLPDNWDYSVAGLVAICKENETSIKSALKELENFGYLRVTKLLPNKNDNRTTISYIYDIFEKPLENQGVDYQGVGFLGVDNLGLENQGQLNTNKLNTNKLNTNNTHIPKLPLPKISVSENFGTENLDTNNNNYKNNNYYNNNNITYRNENEKLNVESLKDNQNKEAEKLPLYNQSQEDSVKDKIKSLDESEKIKKLIWQVVITNRHYMHRPITNEVLRILLDNLQKYSNGNEQLKIEILETATSAGYTTIYPLKNNLTARYTADKTLDTTASYDINSYASEISENYENYLHSFMNKM